MTPRVKPPRPFPAARGLAAGATLRHLKKSNAPGEYCSAC